MNNRLLERQIRKYLGGVDTEAPQLQGFIQAVSDAYDSDIEDRELMNRSMDISSREMSDLYKREEQEGNTNKEAIRILKEAVNTSLTANSYNEYVSDGDSQEEVIRLAHFLSDMVVKYQKTVDELTIQKNHSEELSKQLQIFNLAVENAADLITFFDEDMRFIYANKAAAADTGFGDIIGKTVSEVGARITSKGGLNNFKQHMDAGEDSFISVMDVAGAQGATAIFQTNTTIVRNAQNLKIGINISRDITKDQALKLEKDEFISIASHELRTPMTAIRGFINLLERGQLGLMNAEQKEILEMMSRNTKTLIDLVNDMLDLSRLEANKLDIQISDNQISTLVNITLEKIRILYDSKGIALTYNGDSANIKTDPDKFDRILSNLLGNSLKFTAPGGSVTITSTVNIDRQQVTVCVADTGIGIPPESLNSLFKKFSQVDNALQRKISGTGLGLSICKGLVEKLGGTIWVKSVPGEGSKFYFTMPLSSDIIK